MKKLTIAEQTFNVNEPYQAGHTITEIEAKVLNQTRAENVGNNLRTTIKEALEKGKSHDEMQEIVAKYDGEYDFSKGGSNRVVLDPLEKEARKVAREYIKDYLAEQGRKLKEVEDEALEAEIDRIAQNDQVLELAKERLAAKQKKVQINMSDLGLGDQPQAAA